MEERMRDFLRKLAGRLGIVWTLACMIAGAIIGAATGYANGGWIGAVAVGFCGAVIGGFASRATIWLG
jgi:hypothetical protein